jgi:hypothetical protein
MPKKHSLIIKVFPELPPTPDQRFQYVNQLEPALPGRKLKTRTGEGVRWRLRVFRPGQPPSEPPYIIAFKTSSPFPNTVIHVPGGGLSQEQTVTDFLGGGHLYTVVIPSLNLYDDPEIQVDGFAFDLRLEEAQNKVIKITRNGKNLEFDPAAPQVKADWQVNWTLVDTTGGGAAGRSFTVLFDELVEDPSPFTDLSTVIDGRVVATDLAETPSKQVNPVLNTRSFTYRIRVNDDNLLSEPQTLKVIKESGAGAA